MKRNFISAALACFALLALPAADAFAEKVRGTETCTTGNYPRTIGGKKYNCTSKCTTPVTDTVCNPNCSSTVSIETNYKDCSLAASTQGIRDQIRIPQGGLLEVSPETGGGGRPGATGQPVRPAAPAAPMLR
jgi:hypothetical protein